MFEEPRSRPSNHFFRITTPIIERRKYLDCDLAIYKQRDVAERMFCRFKYWRTATFAIAANVFWRLS